MVIYCAMETPAGSATRIASPATSKPSTRSPSPAPPTLRHRTRLRRARLQPSLSTFQLPPTPPVFMACLKASPLISRLPSSISNKSPNPNTRVSRSDQLPFVMMIYKGSKSVCRCPCPSTARQERLALAIEETENACLVRSPGLFTRNPPNLRLPSQIE